MWCDRNKNNTKFNWYQKKEQEKSIDEIGNEKKYLEMPTALSIDKDNIIGFEQMNLFLHLICTVWGAVAAMTAII